MLQSAMLPTSTAKSSRTLKWDNHCHKAPRLVTLRKLSRTWRMRSKGLYQQGRTRGRLIDKVPGAALTCNLVSHREKLRAHGAFVPWKWVWKAKTSRVMETTEWSSHLSPQQNPNNAARLCARRFRHKLGSSLRAEMLSQTRDMKEGSDAGSGREIKPEKDPGAGLSLLQDHVVTRPCSCLWQEHVSRVRGAEQGDKANT